MMMNVFCSFTVHHNIYFKDVNLMVIFNFFEHL